MVKNMLEAFLIMGSIHLNESEYDRNEVNQGLIVSYDSVVAGGYYNSFRDMSYLVAARKNWSVGNLSYGVIGGGVTGYDVKTTVGGVTAFVAPYINYNIGGIEPTILVMGNAVTFSVGYKF